MADWPVVGEGQRCENFGTTLASSTGTTITAAGSANVKGSFTELVAATPYCFDGIIVNIHDNSAGANYLIDIALGSAGTVIIPDLAVSFARASQAGYCLFLPICVPEGAALSARCQSSSASATVDVSVAGLKLGFRSQHLFQRMERLSSLSSSTGITVDPGATAHVKGSWTSITTTQPSAITFPVRQVLIAFLTNANGTMATARWFVDLGINSGATPITIIPDLPVGTNTTSDAYTQTFLGPFPCAIPGGSVLAARAQCSITDGTDRLMRLMVYGFG